MNAIYNGRLYSLGDDLNVVKLTDERTGAKLVVSFSDPDLIIAPTDDQINNLVPDDRREQKQPRVKVCPACRGSGYDIEHQWPDGSYAYCETCDGWRWWAGD
jgi:hypothetical protein